MIFYFSATGNSEWVAQKLALATGDRTISIAHAITHGESRYALAPGERIGWVFPVHSWGVPPLVAEFMSIVRFDGYDDNYCFVTVTCGDDAGLTTEMCQKALRGITVHAAFSVQMPNIYIMLPGFDTDPKHIEQQKLDAAPNRVSHIAEQIMKQAKVIDVVKGTLPWLKTKMVYPLFKRFGRNSHPYYANEACVSCGLCTKACPVGNISMSNGLPVWGDHCQMCLSCIHHCPTRAIQYLCCTHKKGRYLHE